MEVSRQQVETALRAAWSRAVGTNDEPVQPTDPAGPTGDQTAEGRVPMSPGGRTALLDAVAVALEFGHNYIGTEHILLALYRDPDSLAARVLAESGADASQAQVRIAEMLRGYAKP
jgi:hypothetical protein